MNPQRTAWTAAFPAALILAAEPDVKRHPDYAAAKSGDAASAARLVRTMVSDQAISAIGAQLAGRRPIVASVHAQESQGVNAIPEALADLIAQHLGLATDATLVQANVVSHTGADGFSRLARQALFDGDVVQGAEYLMVDDFIGQGGTLANFRGHIEARGGKVVGAVSLTGKPFSAKLAITDK